MGNVNNRCLFPGKEAEYISADSKSYNDTILLSPSWKHDMGFNIDYCI